MSGQEQDSAEKEHEPTRKKLDDARERGEVPKSTDVTTAASYLGLLVAVLAVGAQSLVRVGDVGAALLERADSWSALVFGGGAAPVGGLLVEIGGALAPIFLGPALLVIVALVAQRAIVFAPEKLRPKGNRLSPLANAQNKFGRSGLFEFAKSFVKLVITSTLLFVYLLARFPDMIATLRLSPAIATALLMRMVVEFLALVAVIAFAIGAIDLLWQHYDHARKNRMSHKELKDEAKQAEGDPHMKQQRRERGHDIATNRMLDDVPQADVVLVNPSHYAVALKWDRQARGAPVCVAKGADEIAARIRERAAEAGVPLYRDRATTRALHATVALGDAIRVEHYKPVAAAIRFAEAMRAKAAQRGYRR